MTTTSASYPIRNRIETGVLMALGARNLRYDDDALIFDATILPFDEGGNRIRAERPLTMRVTVAQEATDMFSVEVTYRSRGVTVTHFQQDPVWSELLNRTLLALDYDGPETINPRLV